MKREREKEKEKERGHLQITREEANEQTGNDRASNRSYGSGRDRSSCHGNDEE